MSREAQKRKFPFDKKGQGYLFPDVLPAVDERSEKIEKELQEQLAGEKYRQVMDYIGRQLRITPYRKIDGILKEMITVPEGDPKYEHPVHFGTAYAKRALHLIADRIDAHEIPIPIRNRLEKVDTYTRLKTALKKHKPYLNDAMESLIERPECIENLDFRTDHRLTDEERVDVFLKRKLAEALSIRNQDQPESKDRELHANLNKLPYPRLSLDDVRIIDRIIRQS